MITGEKLLIPARFRGPQHSGNGGYVSGSLAESLLGESPYGRVVSAALRLPPPLDTELPLEFDEPGKVTVRAPGGAVMAHAELGGDLPVAPAAVGIDAAAIATEGFGGRHDHPFATCFTCGSGRTPGDALRLFTGPVPGRDNTVATVWRPGASFSEAELRPDTSGSPEIIPSRIVWAALDCPGAWAADFDPARPIVLGRISAVTHKPLVIHNDYVVVGESRGNKGRKHFTATALYDRHGQLLAAAEAVWISINPETFAGMLGPNGG